MPRRSPSMVQTPKAFHSINVFSSNSRFCMSKQIAPKFKKSGDEKINLGTHLREGPSLFNKFAG